MTRKKIGVFGGSFDPMHLGHLNMAIALMEVCHLDKVLFCPAYISPFKSDAPPSASPEHRFAMVSLVIKEIPSFSILDWEIHEKGPSYTIDTMKRLHILYKDAELFLLLGEDQLSDLHQWKNVDELFILCKPLIASRENKEIYTNKHFSSSIRELIEKGRIAIPMFDISSTVIRERLKHKRFCGHLVPDLILDYIENHRLYS